MTLSPRNAVAATMFLLSFSLVLFELALTRLFGVVLFATFAHLALGLALMGISAGALLQHMWPNLVPDEGLETRLGWLSLLQGCLTVVAVFLTLVMPITVQFTEPPSDYGERSSISWDLVDPFWFSLLLPVLCAPFIVAGLAFAGTFQRRKQHIGLLYGADLVGGAAAALAFVPLLYTLPGPDTAFVVVAMCSLASVILFHTMGEKAGLRLALLIGLGSSIAVMSSAAGFELLKVKYAAGYAEENVTYTRWTPLTRLALHEDERGVYMLLDNSSASEVILDSKRRARKALEPNRSLVYRIHDPEGARVAILAASAGPEVAVAQSLGFRNIDAIDIAPEIGDVIAEKYPDSDVNPFVVGNTRRVTMDGRAAILHATEPYDIIQMVHANLHSSAGLLSAAWSPSLLETREAFVTYFNRLSDDGTLSFARGPRTHEIARAAVAALQELGVDNPAANVMLIRGNATVVLVKKRAFTVAERDKVAAWLKTRPNQFIDLDPIDRDPEAVKRNGLFKGPIMTDDRPYLDDPSKMAGMMAEAAARIFVGTDEEIAPMAIIYHTLVLQIAFTAGCGLLLLGLPLLRRAPTGLTALTGVGAGLLYVSCLGYGYLAVETVLIHELVLFVGHPTYAITVVILAMLLLSGIGSMVIQNLDEAKLPTYLRGALMLVLVLGALQAWVVPELLHSYAFGLPLIVRSAITFTVLAPLGFFMGMPFPLALRILHPSAAGIVPWAWALNGWMSVVASLATVLVSRAWGYSVAFTIALLAYALALTLVGQLAKIRTAPA